MSAPRLSKEEKQGIIDDWLIGRSSLEISQKYGIDRSYPGMLAKRRGLVVGTAQQRRAAARQVSE